MAENRSTSLLDRFWRLGLWVAYRLLLVAWYVFRPNRQGVFIAVWHGDELIVIRNSYRSWFALPAGGVERGETPVQAASRELREEVGIDMPTDKLRYAGEFRTTFEYKRDLCTVFELPVQQKPEIRADGREVTWADFVGVEAALGLRLAPPVRDYLEARQRALAGD